MAVRDKKVVIHLEEKLYDILYGLANAKGKSMSDYGRTLVIDALDDRELLPNDVVRELVR